MTRPRVTQAEYRADPGAILTRSIAEGPIDIVDEDGKVWGSVHVPPPAECDCHWRDEVERLKALNRQLCIDVTEHLNLHDEAHRLRAENERLHVMCQRFSEDTSKLVEIQTRIEVENERLRQEALEFEAEIDALNARIGGML